VEPPSCRLTGSACDPLSQPSPDVIFLALTPFNLPRHTTSNIINTAPTDKHIDEHQSTRRPRDTARVCIQSLPEVVRRHHVQTFHRVRAHPPSTVARTSADKCDSGLAWHTDDQTLRAKFEEFGQVDEAVSRSLRIRAARTLRRASRHVQTTMLTFGRLS
jgi:hypothetical protein